MNLLPSGHLTVSELDLFTTFYGKDMDKSMENLMGHVGHVQARKLSLPEGMFAVPR